jgi:hypothetical protein
VIRSTGASQPYGHAGHVIGGPQCVYRSTGSRYYGRRVRQLLCLQARASRRPTQLSCSMNHQPFNNSFYVLARGQAKSGHVVLVNGKRHRGATNLPLECFGRTLLRRFVSRCKARRSRGPQQVGDLDLRAEVERSSARCGTWDARVCESDRSR